jgi:hypothetical protein
LPRTGTGAGPGGSLGPPPRLAPAHQEEVGGDEKRGEKDQEAEQLPLLRQAGEELGREQRWRGHCGPWSASSS